MEVDIELLKTRLGPVVSAMKVLLVDDMPMNLDQYRMILLDAGFDRSRIDSANNGLNGLTKLISSTPDLLIADWNMPVMDGYQFVQNLRKHNHLRNVVILMITAESDNDLDKVSPFINSFVRKPATQESIERTILMTVAKKVADPNHPLGKKR